MGWSGLKGWLPPELVRLGREWSGWGIRFKGDYASWEAAWEAARNQAVGYGDPSILAHALRETLAVRARVAAFERDGVLFAKLDYRYPLLAGLMRVAALHEGYLDVLDFGGGLGGVYFMCRPWLRGLPRLRWRVVDQPHLVACGRDQLADGTLGFVERIEDCILGGTPNVAILSGVLHLIPDPSDVLQRIAALGIRHVIVDRTPVIESERDIIAVQVVPSRIVRLSCPARLFAKGKFLAQMERDYRLLADFQALDGVLGGLSRRVEFKGFIFERKST